MKLVQIGLQVCARSHLNVWISLSSLERTNTERKRRILQQWSAFIFITRSGISPEYESDHFSGLVSILEWTGKSNGSLRWRSGDSIRSPSWFIHPVFATLWFSFRYFAILAFSELHLTNLSPIVEKVRADLIQKIDFVSFHGKHQVILHYGRATCIFSYCRSLSPKDGKVI